MQRSRSTSPYYYKVVAAALMFLCGIGIPAPIYTQTISSVSPSFSFQNYTPDDGLPSSEVYHIHQDEQGYIWFSTDNGISRFDGYEFRNYSLKEGLTDPVVFQIESGKEGRLWMTGLKNIIYYYDQDSIYRYKDPQTNSTHFGIGVDQDETIYTRIGNHGIYQLNPNRDTQRVEQFGEGDYCVYEFKGGTLGFAKRKAGIEPSFFDSLSFQFQMGERVVEQIVPNYNDLQTYLDYYPKKWTRIQIGKSDFLIFHHGGWYYFENLELKWTYREDVNIEALHMGPDGAIWAGLQVGGGLRRYRDMAALRRGEYSSFLPGQDISYLLFDRQNNLWVSTTNAGVFYAQPNAFQVFDEQSGLPEEYIYCLSLEDEDQVYFAGRDLQLGHLDRNAGRLRLWPTPVKVKSKNIQWDEQRNLLWVTNRTLQSFSEGQWTFYTAFDSLKNRVRAIGDQCLFLPESGDFVWTGSMGHLAGVDIVTRGQRFLNIDVRPTDIFVDQENKIWIGTVNGLKHWIGNVLVDANFSHDELDARIEAVTEINNNTKVLGTKGYGVIFLNQDWSIEIIDESDGLTSNMVENLHVDDWGRVWVGTLNGLNVIIPTEEGFRVVSKTVENGLPSNEINGVDSKGPHFWLATTKGLVYFRDQESEEAKQEIPLFQTIRVNQQSWQKDSIGLLKHWQNNLQLSFVALDYAQEGKITYRYRLREEAPWNYTSDRSVNLPSLSPGGYRFEVQARNTDRFWSDSAVLPFKVKAPFWQQTWFLILIGILGAFAIYLYVQNRIGKIRQNAEEERRSIERERELIELERKATELEKSALRAQMNPHFIFNSLNSVQGFIATGEKLKANRFLAKFAKLIRSILYQSRQNRVSLEVEISTLKEYLDLEQMRMSESFDYHIEISSDVDQYDTLVPPMLIQPYLENAIKHGLAPKENGPGQIELHIHQEDEEHLRVTVRDNGIGIEESKRRKKTSKSLHKSLGMNITQQRLDMLENKGEEEQVQLVELKDSDGAIRGTEVRFRIRIHREGL